MVDPTTGSESDGEGLGTRSSSPLARVDSDGFGKADERPRRLCRVRGASVDSPGTHACSFSNPPAEFHAKKKKKKKTRHIPSCSLTPRAVNVLQHPTPRRRFSRSS